MKKVVFASLALVLSMTVAAQEMMEDGSRIILPLEAQQCNLPSAPAPIPEPAAKEDLLKAQKNVKKFQADMEVYRTCINKYADNEEVTTGNQMAITNAHNYSVDMEKRVADMFNEAVRLYKASLATQ